MLGMPFLLLQTNCDVLVASQYVHPGIKPELDWHGPWYNLKALCIVQLLSVHVVFVTLMHKNKGKVARRACPMIVEGPVDLTHSLVYKGGSMPVWLIVLPSTLRLVGLT